MPATRDLFEEPANGPLEKTIRATLAYDPETGWLTWKTNGQRADNGISDAGYRLVYVNRKGLRAHRVAFLLTVGRWPTEHIDHINRNREDNRWSNLREVTASENARNKTPFNELPKTGIRPRGQYWEALTRIRRGNNGYGAGTWLSHGLYTTEKEAREVAEFMAQWGPGS
jgi:hypothetical protein